MSQGSQLHERQALEPNEPNEPSQPSEPSTSAKSFSRHDDQDPSPTHATSVADHTSTLTPLRFWRIPWEKIKSKFRSNYKPEEDNIWEKTVLVRIIVGNDELKRTAVVIFDPQCQFDIVSTYFLHTNFPGLTYETLPEDIGTSITGRETYQSIGTVDLRWYGQEPRAHLLNKTPQYRPRFEDSSCRIVESDAFELIIGRDTIDRLHLFQPNNRIIAAFRGLISRADAKDVEKDQQTANEEREKAKKDKKQREKEKKEQQRNQNQPT